MTTPSSDQLTVIFDGASALDSGIRRRLAAPGRIAWVACQATEPDARGGRLCERTLVAITGEGKVDTGWRALARALSVASGARWPYRVGTLPLICPLLSLACAAVAPLLRRLPGVTPWCDEHPEECMVST
jgi:hypothetical protein